MPDLINQITNIKTLEAAWQRVIFILHEMLKFCIDNREDSGQKSACARKSHADQKWSISARGYRISRKSLIFS